MIWFIKREGVFYGYYSHGTCGDCSFKLEIIVIC